MGQIKAMTYLEKLGFFDKDKKKPEHDMLQKWVDRNFMIILKELYPHSSEQNISFKHWEYQIFNTNSNQTYSTLIGFIDLRIDIAANLDKTKVKHYTFFIEVKTEIPSLGELIRQMNTYRAYTAKEYFEKKYLVVSPDDRHVDILNEQGYLFYKYKAPTMLF